MNNNLNGFTLFSQPSRSAAGGVAIYASKSLNAFKRTDLSITDDEFETVWVEINNTKAKNILCCCAYRHPSFNPVRFKEHFESILSQLTRENKNIFIMGDFNINLLTCENHPESNDFILMLNSFFLLPYILQPTRITERSATLIDNIFANTYSMNAISGNLVSKISDHFPQLLIVDNIKVNYKILNYYKYDYTKLILMRITLLMNLQSSTGKISLILIWMQTLNLIFFMIKFLSSLTLMCHVESFQSVKLSYPLNPGLPKKYLPRCNIEIRSIRRFLSVISLIQT